MKYLTEDQDLQVVHDVVEKMFTPDVKFQVIGQPGQFQLAAAGESVQAMKSYYSDALFPAILSVLDVTKPVSSDLISMIHDEPQGMIVMEAKTSGLAKDGTSCSHSLSLSLSLLYGCTNVPHGFSVY